MAWRDRLRRLRRETTALAHAARDPRTPWYAKAVLLLVVGLAVSPVDPIPDVIPVLGYLDDLLFVPAGVLLVRRLVPEDVMADARTRAEDPGTDRWGRFVAVAVVVAYVCVVAWLAWQLWSLA